MQQYNFSSCHKLNFRIISRKVWFNSYKILHILLPVKYKCDGTITRHLVELIKHRTRYLVVIAEFTLLNNNKTKIHIDKWHIRINIVMNIKLYVYNWRQYIEKIEINYIYNNGPRRYCVIHYYLCFGHTKYIYNAFETSAKLINS